MTEPNIEPIRVQGDTLFSLCRELSRSEKAARATSAHVVERTYDVERWSRGKYRTSIPFFYVSFK